MVGDYEHFLAPVLTIIHRIIMKDCVHEYVQKNGARIHPPHNSNGNDDNYAKSNTGKPGWRIT